MPEEAVRKLVPPPSSKPPPSSARKLVLQHRWIQVRLVGWSLIGIWQLLSLASEFIPLDLNQRGVRIAGKVFGLIGLVLVVYGFERLMQLNLEEEKRGHWWFWLSPRVKRRDGGRRRPG